MKKSIVSLLTSSVLIFIVSVALTVTASATIYSLSPEKDSVKNYDKVFSLLYEAIDDCAETVDISRYRLSKNDISIVIADLKNSCPEHFYVNNRFSYQAVESYNSTYVSTVYFEYTMNEKEVRAAKIKYNAELDSLISLVPGGLDEAETALWVHDMLVDMYEYDESYSNYDAYSLMTEKIGVCQAYSLLYCAVMRSLGMECVMMTSSDMGHAWNMVRVDGEWYHVDVTFDDPAPDRIGLVSHENLLLNDNEIAKTSQNHYSWSSSVKSSSTKYSSLPRSSVTSRMYRIGQKWYYIDSTNLTICSSDFNGGNKKVLYTFTDFWFTDSNATSYYVGVYSGLGEDNGILYFNTPSSICGLDTDNGSVKEYLTVFNNAGNYLLYGTSVSEGKLTYLAAKSPDTTKDKYTETVTLYSIAPSENLPFTDVKSSASYYAAVKYVYENGLFKGVSSTEFAPSTSLTRAMFVTVLGRLDGVDTKKYTSSSFDDVANGKWYTEYIGWAADKGIVNGVGNKRFDPDGTLTRAQMYVIIARYAKNLGITAKTTKVDFYDSTAIPEWASESIIFCVSAGLLTSHPETAFRPDDMATRAEAAQAIYALSTLISRK